MDPVNYIPLDNVSPARREAVMRAIRDGLYGRGTDKNWEGCRDQWAKVFDDIVIQLKLNGAQIIAKA